jgi:predicted transcriptional regulator
VNCDKVVGAITLGDLVRSLSSKDEADASFANIYANECMGCKPIYIDQATVCSEADKIMEETGVKALIVVDQCGLPVGSYISMSTSTKPSQGWSI